MVVLKVVKLSKHGPIVVVVTTVTNLDREVDILS